MRDRLRSIGVSDAELFEMTPAIAHERLREAAAADAQRAPAVVAPSPVTLNLAFDHRDQTTIGREVQVPWPQLVASLSDHHRRPDKFVREDGYATCYSLARFIQERCTCGDAPGQSHAGCPDHPANNPLTSSPKGHRIAKNVLGVTAIGIDFDTSAAGGRLTTQEALQILAALQVRGIAAVVYSSHSHTPPDDCHYRVVVAISRELSVDDFNRLRHYVPQYLGIRAGCTSDARHIWFGPSCPPNATPEAYVFEGAPLNVDLLLATVPAAATKASGGHAVEPTDAPPTAQQEAALEILAEHWPEIGTRYDARGELAGALAWHGWCEDDIAEFLDRLAVLTNNGVLKAEVQSSNLRWARSSVSGVQTDGRVTGWPTLAKRIGEDAVREAKRALGYEPPPKVDPGFVEAMSALASKQPEPPKAPQPTADEIFAAIESARDKLKRHASEEDKYASRLLARVLKDDIFGDEEEFQRVALVVASVVPPGTTVGNLHAVLIGCASGTYLPRLDEIIQAAMRAAEQVRAAKNTFAVVDKNGVPKADSAANIRTALDLSEARLAFDAFADREMIQIGDGTPEAVEDHHVHRLADTWEREHGFVINSLSKLHNTISVIAREHSYHPVLDYLDALPVVASEDEKLPQEWLIRFAGAKDTPYVRAVSQLMLVAAVRRVRSPGAKFDEMLVLESPQGRSKSLALRHLVPAEDLFTDAIKLGMSSKELMEIVVGRWIAEVPEMNKGGADGLVKAMLSQQEDSARMAYGRRRRTLRRTFVIVGTTNEAMYLSDSSGNRRYWPVAVSEIDVEGLVAVRDRLWAAAAAIESADPTESCIRLPRELWPDATAEQEKRRQKSAVELALVGTLTPYVAEDCAMTGLQYRIRAEDVRRIALGQTTANRTDHAEVQRVMRQLGWSFIESTSWPNTKRYGGVWCRGDTVKATVYLTAALDQHNDVTELVEKRVESSPPIPKPVN